MSEKRSALPPFKQVANDLRAEILRGEYAPGDKLPSENQLAGRFGHTRVTVRKGLEVLKSEGLTVSHQGKGVFVRERPHVNLRQTGTKYRERRATGVANFNAEAAAQGRKANQVIREVVEAAAPPEIAERLGIEAGAPMVARRLLFLVDGQPMQLVDACYDAQLARGTRLAEATKIRGGANAYIEDPEGPIARRIVQFVEDLDVRMPLPAEAEQLEIPSGVPVARVIRTAYDPSGSPLEVLDSIVPCDRHIFRYVIDV
ncbi:GntR family transcriptional regulator [Streptomyces sp. XM4011]|uniref:GntR family transcriptional regulator n=1 Tax=Streptomyces sp. XM4011 TaxID=2929780 RepID=UPI001FFC1222|nr:GntR family transcriptional regulator [Streptomyces sp. XM4011]MCK1813284.1 GntR family transcriptional regulator [Streptomyces sp. XM4011]